MLQSRATRISLLDQGQPCWDHGDPCKPERKPALAALFLLGARASSFHALENNQSLLLGVRLSGYQCGRYNGEALTSGPVELLLELGGVSDTLDNTILAS